MALTTRQTAYVQARTSGLGQTQAALKAGYAASSAKVIASRMEKLPAIHAAIKAGRKANLPEPDAAPAYDSPESFLLAVVLGTAPADPVRVGAARALLPFLKAKQRSPIPAKSPLKQKTADTAADEREARAAWAKKTAEIRARLAK